MQRYITLWRKAPPNSVLEWDFYPSDSLDEVEKLVANIKKQGVHQYHTYPIGDMIAEHSSEY
jgi:hypothetical protein